MNDTKIHWPEGKTFAFTVFDDTDLSSPGNFEEVYAFLHNCGMRTTKSVWPLQSIERHPFRGSTCEDAVYLKSMLALLDKGFEISFHNTSSHGMPRDQIIQGLDLFKKHFGHYPRSMSNHADSLEAIYWGDARLSGWRKTLYNLLTLNKKKNAFFGHVEDSPFFWGDLCNERIGYVRNFVTNEINTLASCPWMPYHDPSLPYVSAWFAASEGPDRKSFNARISESNQDRLEQEGGLCIMYTHFACGFQENKKLDPRFQELIKRLSRKNGWFAPVSTILDHVKTQKGTHLLTPEQKSKLERDWHFHKVKLGKTT